MNKHEVIKWILSIILYGTALHLMNTTWIIKIAIIALIFAGHEVLK